ncbi:MAG: D-sedoheptulose-7-phosphate isomerase [bacterium]
MDKYFNEASKVLEQMAGDLPPDLDRLPDKIFKCWQKGGRVLSFGNGGSAADSLHFTTELVARFRDEPIARPAVSLNANQCSITAISNDWDFSELFSRQIEAQACADDLLVGISTSGNSKNVIKGLAVGLEKGCACFGLTGAEGGKMGKMDINLITVPSPVTAHVQQAHIACLHWVCDRIDRRLNK